MERRVIHLNVNVQPIKFQYQHYSLCNHDVTVTWPLSARVSFGCCIVSLVAVLLERSKRYFDTILRETIHIYCFIKQCLQSEMIWRQNVLLKQKVMLISREVIVKQARQGTNRQTPTPKSLPQYVAGQVGFDIVCCKRRYATPASPACCTSYKGRTDRRQHQKACLSM